jgi:hypothetical protein
MYQYEMSPGWSLVLLGLRMVCYVVPCMLALQAGHQRNALTIETGMKLAKA